MIKIKVLNSQTLLQTQKFEVDLVTRSSHECIIGRSPHSGLVLDSPDVSRLHGKLIVEDGDYYFCDLGSRNGSMVSGKVTLANQRHILQPGDIIRLGEFILTVEEISSPNVELSQIVGGINEAVISGGKLPIEVEPLKAIEAPAPELQFKVIEEVPVQVSTPFNEIELVAIQESQPFDIELSPAPMITAEQMPQAEHLESECDLTSIQDFTTIQVKAPSTTNSQATEVASTSDVNNIPVSDEIAASESNSHPEEFSQFEATYVQLPESAFTDFTRAELEALNIISIMEADNEVPHWQDIEGSSEPPISEVTHIQLEEVPASEVTHIQLEESSEVPEIVISPPVISDLDASEVNQIRLQPNGEIPQVASAPVAFEVTEVSATDIIIPVTEPEVIEAADASPVAEPEVANISPPETTQTTKPNRDSQNIRGKYIALMAHDSKKSELVQLVAEHEKFFSECHTIATPLISEILSQQAGVTISQQSPAVPFGGYQIIASLVGAGEILAIIFLRDFLVTQSEQANEEALIRLCNVNQVLLATNVPTAEAIVHYIQNLVKSS